MGCDAVIGMFALAALVPFMFLVGGLMFATYSGVVWLLTEGSVGLPASSAAVELTGVSGDEIRFRLFAGETPAEDRPDRHSPACRQAEDHPWDAHVEERSEFFVRLRDGESEAETIAPLQLEREAWFEPRVLYGVLVVPEMPAGRSPARLDGILQGAVALEGCPPWQREWPVHLRVVPPGEGVTSGHKDLTWARRVGALGIIALGVRVATGLIRQTRSRKADTGESAGQGGEQAEERGTT